MPKKSTTNNNPNKKINDKKMPKKKRQPSTQYNIEEFSGEIGDAIISNQHATNKLKKLKSGRK